MSDQTLPAPNLGLAVCVAMDETTTAQDWSIAVDSEILTYLTEQQNTILTLNNAEETDLINKMSTETDSNKMGALTSAYNLASSQDSAAQQQLTSEESQMNTYISNRTTSVTNTSSNLTVIMQGLGTIVSLLAS